MSATTGGPSGPSTARTRASTGRGRICAGGAALALVATVVSGCSSSGGAAPAHRGVSNVVPAATRRPIPFTSAAISATSPGTYTLTWQAAHSGTVRAYAGSSPQGATGYVGRGSGTGRITVHGSSGREWVRLVPQHGGSLEIESRNLHLSSDQNFRDLGGYRAADGRWVRSGLIYRAGAPTLDRGDLARVATLGLRSDYDLRTPTETKSDPDVVPSGVHPAALNLYGVDRVVAPPLRTSAAAGSFMVKTEKYLVDAPSARTGLHTLLTDFARSGTGADLVHCTSGKDRTGWAGAVLLTVLGVPHTTVMRDYLLSNRYVLDSAQTKKFLSGMTPDKAAVFRRLLDVEPGYLNAGFAEVEHRYGSFAGYVRHGLNISSATLHQLRTRLLEGSPTA